MKILLLSSLLLLLTSCSSNKPAPAIDDDSMSASDIAEDIVSMELFLNRSSVSQEEFELLKILNDKLYVECGAVKGGRLTPRTQTFDQAPPARLATLRAITGNTISDLEAYPRTFAQPGSGKGFSDPGKFYLTVTTSSKIYKIKTSLDSIAEPETSSERNLKEIAEELRGLSESGLCGNNAFYGLQSENS